MVDGQTHQAKTLKEVLLKGSTSFCVWLPSALMPDNQLLHFTAPFVRMRGVTHRLLSPALLLLLLLLLPACESDYHARVHWLPDMPQAAAQPSSPPRPVFVEPRVLPQTHSGFTYMPTYPRTLSTWKDEALLKEKNGERRVVIDLPSQRGLLFIKGMVAMDFPVCTGKADKPTPTGSYTITQKNIHHHSNLYHVPMPYFMRLTNDGIGLHAGRVGRKPASHGCIRLQQATCKLLFSKVSLGTPVIIR